MLRSSWIVYLAGLDEHGLYDSDETGKDVFVALRKATGSEDVKRGEVIALKYLLGAVSTLLLMQCTTFEVLASFMRVENF